MTNKTGLFKASKIERERTKLPQICNQSQNQGQSDIFIAWVFILPCEQQEESMEGNS